MFTAGTKAPGERSEQNAESEQEISVQSIDLESRPPAGRRTTL